MKNFDPICIIKSVVVHGNHLGRTVGMPTANFDTLKIDVDIPEDGVYGSTVVLPNGEEKYSITNVGIRPSIDMSPFHCVETHILDFDGDLYDQILEVRIIKRIRKILKFNSLDEVKDQVDIDIRAWRAYIDEV